ncbi:MAG: CYTH domain-containing protein [Natronospirillum sp.]
MSDEIELKLLVAPGAIATLLALPELSALASSCFPLLNRYFDTPDRALSQAGIALRLRYQHGHWLQTLKSRGRACDGLHQRDEWEMSVAGEALEWDRLPTEALPENLSTDQVFELFETNFERSTWLIDRPHATIELALDQGWVSAAGRQTPISELELELKSGQVAALFELAETIAEQIPLLPSNTSKAERGFALLNDELPTPSWPDTTLPGVRMIRQSRVNWQAQQLDKR